MLRARDRIGLSAHYFFAFAAIGFVVGFVPLFLKSRGLTLTQIGMLAAVYALSGAAAQVPMGMLSDRLRRRKPLIVGGTLVLGASYLLYGLAESFAAFCALYLVGGIVFFTIVTLTNALISDWTVASRSTAATFGRTRIWGSLGFILTLSLVSALPVIVEGANLLPGIALLYWLSGMAIVPVSELERPGRQPHAALSGVPKLLGNANLTVFLLAFLMYRLSEVSGMNYLSLYLQELGGNNSLIAMAFVASAVVEIPFMVWVGRASDRIGRRPPLVVAFLVLPLRLFLYSRLVDPMDVFFVQMFHGLTFSFMLVSSLVFVADLSPGELRATGQGLLNMTSGVAMAVGPFLGGWVADRTSISSMYGLLVWVALGGALVFLLLVCESHPELSGDSRDPRPMSCPRFLRPLARILFRPLIARRGKVAD